MNGEPFEDVEPYYQRLFQEIKDRHEPRGTGGDMECLIAMTEWLWKQAKAVDTDTKPSRRVVETSTPEPREEGQ